MWCFFCCRWFGLVDFVVHSVASGVLVDGVAVDVVGVYVEVVVDMVLVVDPVHVTHLEVVVVGDDVPKREHLGITVLWIFSFGCVTIKCPRRNAQCSLFAARHFRAWLGWLQMMQLHGM